MAVKQQDYRLQQEILRNIQHSSQWDPRRPAVIHISPAASASPSDAGNLVFTLASREETPSNSNSPPTSLPDATTPGAPAGPSATLNRTNFKNSLPQTSDPRGDSNTSRILLADGTEILLNRPDHIILNGPTGLQMTINCLPLYKLPHGYGTPSPSTASSSTQEADQPLHMATSVPSLPSILSTPTKSLSSPLKSSTLPLDASIEDVDWGLDEGSDTDENKAEEDNLSIKYVATQDAVPLQLIRSSGSVSFARVNATKPSDCFTPISEVVEPTTEGMEPTIKGVEPTVEGVEPTVEGVEPTVEGVEPTVEGMEPTIKRLSGEEENRNAQVPSKTDVGGQVPVPAPTGRTPPQIPAPYSKHSANRYLSTPPLPTPLPTPPPPCMEPQYMERSGWLSKLSHRKGVFGDRWQRRYFVLHQAQLLYFKKYGDAKPKGRILLLPGGWCKAISQGTPRMADALLNGTSNNTPAPVMTVLRCIGIHRPSNPARSLSALLVTEGVADAFSSQTVMVNTPEQASRTFYVTASSNDERNAWVAAVQHNLNAYVRSPEALRTACIELQSMLCAVSCKLPEHTMPSLLTLLYTKMQAQVSKQPP
ncbi:hypothetical protein EMCRGX_G026107 [Ephydatia muelleri]